MVNHAAAILGSHAAKVPAPTTLPGLDAHALFAAHCRATGQWGIALHHTYGEQSDYTKPFVTGHYFGDVLLAAPDLAGDATHQALGDGGAYFFGSEEEIQAIYDRTVGDDGPTKSNPYAGPVRVYALTCAPDGQLMNENT